MKIDIWSYSRLFAALVFLGFFVFQASAQEGPPLDWDFDTLFDEPEEASP
jgi:hypothetical protein